MLYKYHVAIIKDDMVVSDKYYQSNDKPDNNEFENLKKQYEADKIILNTIMDDDELELFEKEVIDI